MKTCLQIFANPPRPGIQVHDGVSPISIALTAGHCAQIAKGPRELGKAP
jgi:hypothetical protein